ncbi:hypothetical protein PoB_004323600 [Plakobranchus ocellatus]|uniref:Uncharacterized protein n=1 Tax=Plakobranchus ocellatus TaxID=259542 RepID=A0AAV4B8G6_9GAST|nr:hypothetical protein PoB_004323600 [Plakobranchus ocellatus]
MAPSWSITSRRCVHYVSVLTMMILLGILDVKAASKKVELGSDWAEVPVPRKNMVSRSQRGGKQNGEICRRLSVVGSSPPLSPSPPEAWRELQAQSGQIVSERRP